MADCTPNTYMEAYTQLPQAKPGKKYEICYHCGSHVEIFPNFDWKCPYCHGMHEVENGITKSCCN